MARPLADFRGERIYLDTNILVGLVDADSVYHIACETFFQRTLDPAQPIHLAVMKRLGLTAIASDDEGFDRYQDQGMTLFLP